VHVGEDRDIDIGRTDAGWDEPPRGAPAAIHKDVPVARDDNLARPAPVRVPKRAAGAEKDDFETFRHGWPPGE
jgi:hypothetical protein